MTDPAPPRQWPDRLRQGLQRFGVAADEQLDSAFRRMDARLGWRRPRHIAAYRGYADPQGVELLGRVLANRPLGGPGERDDWWDNLLNTYRRFESDEVPDAWLIARYGDADARVRSDHEGYYAASLPPQPPQPGGLWCHADIALADGSLATRQPVLQVLPQARIGILSDIDDTILESSITHWKTAAQLTFLHNARTRKPLLGVSKLYAALQAGADHAGCHPIFYVSSSPWNLYELLDDFLELNGIPPGPIFLRDFGLDAGKFITTPGHGHKLERVRQLVARMPQLRWVLLGDSGQSDAELYAQAAREFGERIAAIYIRDVDPDVDSPLDQGVDAWIERVAGTRVPMLRATDSLAMAEHAVGLGLIDPAALPVIAAEVRRDLQRPSLGEAALEGVEAITPDAPPTPPA